MKPWYRILQAFAILAAFAALLLAPETASAGVTAGLELCIRRVLPALFPYFVLSGLTVKLGMTAPLCRLLAPVMERCFSLPRACAPAVLLGFLGGYPLGARTAAELYRSGVCSREALSRLLAFCSNSGPGFLVGFVGAAVFGSVRIGLVLYVIHVVTALLVGLLLSGGKGRPSPGTAAICAVPFPQALVQSLGEAVQSSLSITGAVVFFSVLLSFLPFRSPVLLGLIEVTGGISHLSGRNALSLATASGLMGWGGLCVHVQALSVLQDTGVPLSRYFLGKALHGIFSAAAAFVLFSLAPAVPVSAPAMVAETEISIAQALQICGLPLFFLIQNLIFAKRTGKKQASGI